MSSSSSSFFVVGGILQMLLYFSPLYLFTSYELASFPYVINIYMFSSSSSSSFSPTSRFSIQFLSLSLSFLVHSQFIFLPLYLFSVQLCMPHLNGGNDTKTTRVFLFWFLLMMMMMHKSKLGIETKRAKQVSQKNQHQH